MIYPNYPLTYCLKPIRYYNPYLREDIVTPCGHCAACLTNKSNRNKTLLDLHVSAYKYNLYITLTYSNEHIPLATLQDIEDKTYMLDEDGVILSSCDRLSQENKDKLYRKIQSKRGNQIPYGKLPYLCSYDLRLFLIRLRQRISTKKTKVYKQFDTKKYRLTPNKYRTDEKITYYAVGEYGPETFRPHFHIILSFNEYETLQALEHHLHKAWPFGNIDKKIADFNVTSYLTSYVTGSSYIPQIYRSASVRPFARKSLHFAFHAQADFNVQLTDFEYYRDRAFVKVLTGKDRIFRFTNTYKCSIYPKITGLGEYDIDILSARYQLYQRLVSFYSLQKLKNVNVKTLIDYVILSQKLGSVVQPLEDAALPLSHFDFSTTPAKGQMTFNTLYKILLISKHFYKITTFLQLNPFNYVRRIIDFWSSEKLQQLNYSLSKLELNDDVKTTHLYYHPLEELCDLDKSSLYSPFEEFVQSEATEQIKHKSANDLNNLLYNF